MYSRTRVNPPAAGGTLDTRRTLDVEAFARSYGGVTVSRFKAGTLLYSQGEPDNAMYCLREGQIQITVVSSDGKEGILDVIDPGSFFGESCLLGNRLRVATAVCMTDCLVARLESASIVRAVRENPTIAELFVVFGLTKAAQLRESMISQLFDSSEKRLARTLVLLANHGGRKNIIRNIDQEGLAQMIGTTRPRVNYFMNKFRKLGYIQYTGSIIFVHSSLSDVALCEGVFVFDASDDRLEAAG